MIKEFAVCFSGQPRCIYEAEKDFKVLFKNLEYDIFAHIWDSDNLLSSWGHNMGWEGKKTKVFKSDEFNSLYNPVSFIAEEYENSPFHTFIEQSPGYRNPVNKVYSSYSQFFSIMKSFDVMKEHEIKNEVKYKYCVKYRMDLDVDFEFSKLVTDEDISNEWTDVKKRLDSNPNLIIVNPGYDWPNGNGVSNLLAIGSSDSMYKFSRMFDYYPTILKSCSYPEYDEANLKLFLEQFCKLQIEVCNINVGVYR